MRVDRLFHRHLPLQFTLLRPEHFAISVGRGAKSQVKGGPMHPRVNSQRKLQFVLPEYTSEVREGSQVRDGRTFGLINLQTSQNGLLGLVGQLMPQFFTRDRDR